MTTPGGTAKNNRRIEDHRNYQTLRSTFVMGGSSVVNIFLGIIRNKLIALLLDPAGLGLTGVYQSISNLATTVIGLGINESGARQVAVSFGVGKDDAISRTSLALRRVALLTGIVGTIALFLLSKPISLLTFHTPEHASDIAFLSLTIVFGCISGGQLALIQGARRIASLAKVNMLGPLLGTVLSLPIIYFCGMKGIIAYLVIMAATNILTSWWYSRKIIIPTTDASWRDSFHDAKPLLKLGTALMVGNIIGVAAAYLLRIIIIRVSGLDAAGEFQATTILSTVYVGILFKAMATDYYPRLSAVSTNEGESTTLVNEQIEASMLMAVPGVLLTLTLAPLVMIIFYSQKFLPAVWMLRWQVLGVLIQVISWPLGYILRARAAGKLFVATELFSNVAYLVLTWVFLARFGLAGIGLALFISNILYLVVIYFVVHKKYGFSFLPANTIICMYAVATTLAALFVSYAVPRYSIPINICITMLASVYTYRKLSLSQWVGRFLVSLKRKAS